MALKIVRYTCKTVPIMPSNFLCKWEGSLTSLGLTSLSAKGKAGLHQSFSSSIYVTLKTEISKLSSSRVRVGPGLQVVSTWPWHPTACPKTFYNFALYSIIFLGLLTKYHPAHPLRLNFLCGWEPLVQLSPKKPPDGTFHGPNYGLLIASFWTPNH